MIATPRNLLRAGLGLSVATTLAACAAMPPQGVSADQAALYDSAVASMGCVMETEREYLAVELQTGMTREQTIQMGQNRMAAGVAEPTEAGGVRLTTGACA